MNRAIGASILAVFSVLTAAGCAGGPSRRSVEAPASLEAIAGRITDVVSGHGIPIEDDYIRCTAALDGTSAVCHGQTADEPAEDINGTFDLSAAASGAAALPSRVGCPGTLVVSIGPPTSDIDAPGPVSELQVTEMDPCR